MRQLSYNLVIAIALSTFGLAAMAVTQVRTLPVGGQVLVTINSASGADDDMQTLYNILNLSEKDSGQGKGKGFKSSKKEFTVACGKERKLCTFVLNPSRFLKKGPQGNQFQFQVNHEEWPELKNILINLNRFETSDRVLFMESSKTQFILKTN